MKVSESLCVGSGSELTPFTPGVSNNRQYKDTHKHTHTALTLLALGFWLADSLCSGPGLLDDRRLTTPDVRESAGGAGGAMNGCRGAEEVGLRGDFWETKKARPRITGD